MEMESTAALENQLFALFKKAVMEKNLKRFLDQSRVILSGEYDADVKTIIELVVRKVLLELIRKVDNDVLEVLFQFSIDIAIQDLCPVSLPVSVFGDMLDGSTISECEKIFSFIENRVDVFTKDMFFKSSKIHLLRACNDLLRRLSRSQNTVFCGRILVFLARMFPLSERSGLNIISEFNYENTTIYSSKDDLTSESDKDDTAEEGEIPVCPIATDYTLYKKFWSLQEFFRSPNTCYNKIHWKHFTSYASDILTVFGSFKSDDATSSKWRQGEGLTASGCFGYFAKYLTSQKLLELELSDSNFRRYLLIQFLILFQYLSIPVKFKLDTHVLTEEQQAWVKEATKKVYKLLDETPPDGAEFSKSISKILKREEQWNAWKNEGCPDFKNVDEKTVWKTRAPKKRLGDEMAEARKSNKVLCGNAELTRLWNVCPDNWEACKSAKRKFVPGMDEFFCNAIEQADPANGIENRYKDVNDPKFSWRALHLLSRNSLQFFTASHEQTRNVSEFIESVIQTIPKQGSQQEISPEENVSTVTDEVIEDTQEEMMQTEDEPKEEEKTKKVDLLTKAHMEALSTQESFLKNWTTLATHLAFKEDEVAYLDSRYPDTKEKLEKMLTVWTEQAPCGGSLSTFKTAVKGAGLTLPSDVFSST